MEPDEHLLNLSEKGRVEIANEVQPQRRAGPGRAGPGSQALRERIIHLAAAQCLSRKSSVRRRNVSFT